MQSSNDFLCVDCRENFGSASELLKHFAQHVSTDILNNLKHEEKLNKKQNVPDLYPISVYKQLQDGDQTKPKETDGFNPLKFCEVTMNDNFQNGEGEDGVKSDDDDDDDSDSISSKFQCKFCGYSCMKGSLLRSHMKYHKHAKMSDIPGLNPMKMKSRKQEKCNIKRKTYGTKLLRQSNELLCT
nr:uncharacterized protein LOC111415781 [Onthophagus taurus]